MNDAHHSPAGEDDISPLVKELRTSRFRDWRLPMAVTALLVAAGFLVSIITMSYFIGDARQQAREARALLAQQGVNADCRTKLASQLEVLKVLAVADGVENQAAVGDAVALVLGGNRDPATYVAASERIAVTAHQAKVSADRALVGAQERLNSITGTCAPEEAPVLASVTSTSAPGGP